MNNMSDEKFKRIIKITGIICAAIILVEACVFFFLRYQREASIVYYDAYQMAIVDGDFVVAVGSSDFKKSTVNDYTEGVEKGKLVKYDREGNVVFEIKYDHGMASTFTSVLATNDAYYVTGSGVFDDYQQENNIRDAFFIKYDKEGNKLWEKYYGVLSNTRFNQAILVEDGIVVIGQSIYENMEVGNHTTGGGVIVKYDFEGNEVWHNNHGGNKSGNFNGIAEVGGDFYVVGKDASDSGNLIKFNQNGEYVWHKNYSYTDSMGLQDIVYFNQQLYVVGSKKILEDEKKEDRKTENTDGVLLVFDKKGNLKEEKTFGGSKNERFMGIEAIEDSLYVTGVSNSLDSSLEIQLNDSEDTIVSGFILKYNQDLDVVSSKVLGGKNNDVLTRLVKYDNTFYISGYSNSKDGTISKKGNNGKDYFGKIISVSPELEISVFQ